MWIEVKNKLPGFYIKYTNENDKHNFFLTNFIKMWKTSLDPDALENSLVENNPLLDSDDSSLTESCMMLIHDGILRNEIDSVVKLENENATLEFIVTKDSSIIRLPLALCLSDFESFSKELILPLLMKLEEMQKSEDALTGLLEKKDKEISEYKMEGAILALKHMETETFCIKKHNSEYKTSDLLLTFKNNPLPTLRETLGIPNKNLQVKKEIKKRRVSSANIVNRNVNETPSIKNDVSKVEIKIEPSNNEIIVKSEVLDVKPDNYVPSKKLKMNNNKRKLNF